MGSRKSFFNSLACDWDKKFYTTEREKEGLDRHCELYRIEEGQKVLDAGCGTGVMFGRMKKLAGRRGIVVGVDFSAAMIKRAKQKHKNCRRNFVCADACSLPFGRNIFDRVVYFSSFPHFSNKQKAFKEAFRVLKPDGIMVISHLCSRRKISQIHKRAGRPVTKDILPLRRQILTYVKCSGMRLICFKDKKELYLLMAQKIIK